MRLFHVLVLLLMAGRPALAQSPEPPVEVGLAVGYAHALHGDLDYGSAVFSGSVRFPIRARLALEGDLGYWSHSEMQAFGATQARSRRSFWSIEGSLLFVGSAERVQPFVGGGLGVYFERSSFAQVSTQRVDFELTRTQGPHVGAQALGGIDVAVARRLKIFGAFRFELRSFADPGGGAVYRIDGGVRLPIRDNMQANSKYRGHQFRQYDTGNGATDARRGTDGVDSGSADGRAGTARVAPAR